MDKLFSEVVRIDEERSVGVEELPDGSFGIRALTIDSETKHPEGSNIRFSPETLEALRGILNRKHEEEKSAVCKKD